MDRVAFAVDHQTGRHVPARHPTQSLADDFDENALSAPSIELAVEDLLPGTEIELAIGDGDHHLAPHDLPLQVRVGIVLAGPVVAIARDRLPRGQALEPDLIIVMETAFVVVDE